MVYRLENLDEGFVGADASAVTGLVLSLTSFPASLLLELLVIPSHSKAPRIPPGLVQC